jgi:large subunit ribosomal protein L31
VKKGIHPEYKEATIVCACGNTVHTHSAKENIHVEICSKCHPFYTGKQKLVDSAGMVERFQKRYKKGKMAKGKEPESAGGKTVKEEPKAKEEGKAGSASQEPDNRKGEENRPEGTQ